MIKEKGFAIKQKDEDVVETLAAYAFLCKCFDIEPTMANMHKLRKEGW